MDENSCTAGRLTVPFDASRRNGQPIEWIGWDLWDPFNSWAEMRRVLSLQHDHGQSSCFHGNLPSLIIRLLSSLVEFWKQPGKD
ncbi:hypothetical protein BaRGS_00028608 [Batillaria attramentaria]|uniref:Uncharacterized protein n=1 Tax=Batillaria attramentaria TaxID=370345 RepID=A0ABD0JYR1_9CAEN